MNANSPAALVVIGRFSAFSQIESSFPLTEYQMSRSENR